MVVDQGKLITVGIADMRVSQDEASTIVTYSLGSCVGVVIYDPVVKVGGILHAMLPEAGDDRKSPGFNPFKYVDSGIPLLFKEAYKYGAKKNRLNVYVTGAAQILDDSGYFNIGKRNLAVVRKLFWKNGVMVDKEHVGGSVSRTVRLFLEDGLVTVKLGWGDLITL